MGVLNVTPDSFSDGGQFFDPDKAVSHAQQMIKDGADLLDIGAESTRPGAIEISAAQECARVVPIIRAVRALSDIPISIDSRKTDVAQAAINAGATIWNDVSALTFSPHSLAMAAGLNRPVIVMHAQGPPETMQDNPSYHDPVEEIKSYLAARIQSAVKAGVKRSNIIVDPGIGFGKRLDHNLAILSRLDDFHALGCSVLIGASRKSFIGQIHPSPPDQRLGGSLASALWAAALGADIIRVHDVFESVQAMKTWGAIANG